jgi:hypothetical protein
MKVIKAKYKLVLTKKDGEEVLWKGTKRECEKKKLDLSFQYNSGKLVVEEDEPETKEIGGHSFKGILGFLAVASLTYICWISGKKICIVD